MRKTPEQLSFIAKEEAARGSVASVALASDLGHRPPPPDRNTTSIEWTHREGYVGCSWNPTRGCSRVSPGCVHCYAEVLAGRFSDEGLWGHGFATRGKAGARWTGKVELVPAKLAEPLSWHKPHSVFVNSMSDLFHESLTFEEIAAVVGVIAATPQHIYMTLTKRAKRMREWFEWIQAPDVPADSCLMHLREQARAHQLKIDKTAPGQADLLWDRPPWPLANLQIGISAEDQQRWDERVPELLRCPAAVRFVSAEPLISGIQMAPTYRRELRDSENAWSEGGDLHQLIIGGESGPGARPCHVEWIRDLRDQGRAAGCKIFVKQLGAQSVIVPLDGATPWDMYDGGKLYDTEAGLCLRLKSKKGGDWDEWPEDLRIREQV